MGSIRACRLCHVGVLTVVLGACTSGSIGDSFAAPSGIDVPRSPNGSPGIDGTAGGSGNPGVIEPDEPAAPSGCSGVACERESAVASSAFPRLSHRQWAASVRDLLFLDAVPEVSRFTNDAPTGTSFDNNGGALVVSAGLATDYETAVEKQAADLVANASRLAKVVPAGLPADLDGYAKGFGSEGDPIEGAQEMHHEIDKLHARLFKYLLDKLASYSTPDGTLLDSGVAAWTNDLAHGVSHGYNNVPWILAGSAGGYLKQGQYVDGGNVTHNRLFNTLLNALGVRKADGSPVDDFGDPSLAKGEIASMKA